jgi:Phosphate-starvation-inducible E family
VTITKAVNDVLFIVVVLELLRTIVSRLEGGGFQLQPFLVIGIISATRDILTVGAELSLVGGQGPTARTDDRTGRQRRRGGRVVGGPGSHTAFRPA